MKAITLTQPWATLVAIGAKRYETRSWTTAYRGEIAVHAAKGFPVAARNLLDEDYEIGDALAEYGVSDWHQLPLGEIVAVASLTNTCRTCGRVPVDREGTGELHFGDFTPGRWLWRLENVQLLAAPVPCRGALGLWDVPPLEEQRIRRQLECVAS